MAKPISGQHLVVTQQKYLKRLTKDSKGTHTTLRWYYPGHEADALGTVPQTGTRVQRGKESSHGIDSPMVFTVVRVRETAYQPARQRVPDHLCRCFQSYSTFTKAQLFVLIKNLDVELGKDISNCTWCADTYKYRVARYVPCKALTNSCISLPRAGILRCPNELSSSTSQATSGFLYCFSSSALLYCFSSSALLCCFPSSALLCCFPSSSLLQTCSTSAITVNDRFLPCPTVSWHMQREREELQEILFQKAASNSPWTLIQRIQGRI